MGIKAFEGDGGGLLGYEQLHVIVERLALVALKTFQTRFYTSAYAARPGFEPVGEARFRFPNTHSLLELVTDLHRQLSAMELQNKLVPARIDEKIEFATIQHSLLGAQSCSQFYGIFNAMVHHYGAVEITQR